uniref:Uncharacterized protein n=1 Tax=Oryza glumipatula TaxID=40148 RepID=A0A0D9ZEG9_9ORYZ
MALGSLAGGDMKPLATLDDLDTIILFSYRWPLPSAMTSTRATTCCLVDTGIVAVGEARHELTRPDLAFPHLDMCLLVLVLGEEEAEVDPIGGGNPKGGGDMGFLVEEVVLNDSGGGLRFRQNIGGGPRGGGRLGVWEVEEDPDDSDGPMGSGDLAI